MDTYGGGVSADVYIKGLLTQLSEAQKERDEALVENERLRKARDDMLNYNARLVHEGKADRALAKKLQEKNEQLLEMAEHLQKKVVELSS